MRGNVSFNVGERAHEISVYLGIPYWAAWKVAKCVTKASFPTRARAQRSADEWGQDVYRCPICGQWHTATRKGGERRE